MRAKSPFISREYKMNGHGNWDARLGDSGGRGLLFLGFELTAHFRRGLRQHPVVDGEQCQFQAVAYADFIVDRAPVILDHLFSGLEAECDLAGFAALDNEGHDAHLLRREAVADTRADPVTLRKTTPRKAW